MRIFLSLSIAFFSVVFSINAIACQPSYQFLLEIDDYYQYDDRRKKSFYDNDDLFVAIVYTKKKSSESAEKNYKNHRDDDSGRLDKMQLKLIERIKGKPPKTVIVPRMTQKEIAREKKYMTESMDMFDYWDGLQFSYASSDWYGMESMCSPVGKLTLINKQHYLIIGYGDDVYYTEPIADTNDVIVESVKGLLARDKSSPLRISSKSFMEEMNGFQTVRVKHCPEFEYGFDQYAMMWRDPDIPNTDKMFENLDEDGIKIELETANFFEIASCNIGDRYLIVERPYKYYKRARGSALDMPKHRFLKITNGNINVDDIPTNYEFTSEKIIPIEKVKTWIKEGRQKAGVVAD